MLLRKNSNILQNRLDNGRIFSLLLYRNDNNEIILLLLLLQTAPKAA